MQNSQSILDQVPTAITAHDTSGRILFANKAFRVLTEAEQGSDAAQIEQAFLSRVQKEDRGLVDYHSSHRTVPNENASSKFSFRIEGAQGTLRWIEGLVTAADWDGKPAFLTSYCDVTQHHVGEEAGKGLRSLLERAFNAVPCPVVVSSVKNGNVLYINDAAVSFYQYDREEIVGKSVVKDINIWLDPSDREEVAKRLGAGESLQEFQTVHRVKDGSERPIIFYGTRIETEPAALMVAVIIDRTNEIQHIVQVAEAYAEASIAEEAARERSVFFGEVLDNLNHGMTVLSKDLKLIAWNTTMLQTWNYPKGLLVEGLPFRELVYFDAARGLLGEGDPQELADNILLEMEADGRFRKDNRHEQALQNGRILDIQNRIMTDGAIVTTFADITDRKKREEGIIQQAMKDRLTGVANRRGFDEGLRSAMEKADEDGNGVILAMLDLDNFKAVNDTYGHGVGDATLKFATDVLLANIRDTDFVARLGGDEFAVVFQNTDNIERARERVTVMVEKIRAQKRIEECEINIGASGGVGLYPRDGRKINELMENVDAALYEAKKAGKGQVCVAGSV